MKTLVKFRPVRDYIFANELDPFFNFLTSEADCCRETGVDFTPHVDVVELEKNIELRAELPGIEKNDIEISFKDDVLTIKGERKNDKREAEPFIGERQFGRFERFFRMTVPVEDDKISAKYKNGILTVNIPKANVPEPVKIKVK